MLVTNPFSGYMCFKPGYIGGDYNHAPPKSPIQSPLECQRICQETDGCKAFEYKYTLKQCNLKNAFVVGGVDINDKMVAGPKYCP